MTKTISPATPPVHAATTLPALRPMVRAARQLPVARKFATLFAKQLLGGGQPDRAQPAPEASRTKPVVKDCEARPAPTEDAPTDSLARALGQQAPHPFLAGEISPAIAPSPKPPVKDALTHAHEIVERIALWGDGTAGVARLRMLPRAKGGLSSATVALEQREGVLHLSVTGADATVEDELRARLAAKGLTVE